MLETLEELMSITGVTFVSVYVAISGCAIIKTSAALTYRLAVVVESFCKKKRMRGTKRRLGKKNLVSRQDSTKKERKKNLLPIVFLLLLSSSQSACLWPHCQTASGKDVRSRVYGKMKETLCYEKMDIFSSSRAFFHIRFYSRTVNAEKCFIFHRRSMRYAHQRVQLVCHPLYGMVLLQIMFLVLLDIWESIR